MSKGKWVTKNPIFYRVSQDGILRNPHVKINNNNQKTHSSKSKMSHQPRETFQQNQQSSRINTLENQLSKMSDLVEKLVLNQSSPQASSSIVKPKGRKCYLCGNKGHLASECTETALRPPRTSVQISEQDPSELPDKDLAYSRKMVSVTPMKWTPKESKETPSKGVPKQD